MILLWRLLFFIYSFIELSCSEPNLQQPAFLGCKSGTEAIKMAVKRKRSYHGRRFMRIPNTGVKHKRINTDFWVQTSHSIWHDLCLVRVATLNRVDLDSHNQLPLASRICRRRADTIKNGHMIISFAFLQLPQTIILDLGIPFSSFLFSRRTRSTPPCI